MKKIFLSVFVIVAVSLFCGMAQALISVGVLAANYNAPGANVTGYGFEVEVPLLPLITTRVDATFAAGTNAGGTYNIAPIMLNGSYKLPFFPLYVGAGIGAAMFSQAGAAVPSPMVYDVFVGYEQNILPMTSLFIQGGSMNMAVNYSIGAININQNMSGTSVTGGVRVGI